METQKDRCLVLGGGGFLGSAIVDRLLKDGYSVRVLERPRIPPYRIFGSGEQVEWIAGDVMSQHDLMRAMAGVSAVIHLVSTTLPRSSNDDPIHDVESNLLGSLRLLNTMAQQKVVRLVFISSGGTVYGVPKYLPIDEQHPTDPQVSYGITKLAIEKYALLYEGLHGIVPLILRVANPYGERQRIETAQGAVGVFVSRALRREPIEIWGDGSVTRDYLHVSDVADAIPAALRYAGRERVFNIGSGRGTSLNELLALLEATLEAPVARRYLPGRPFDVRENVLSCELARRELGWVANVSLADGLSRTVAWQRANMGQL